MFFALTGEQRQRQEALRRLLDELMPDSVHRALMADPAGTGGDLWRRLTPGLPPGDADSADVAATLEVLGERLTSGPYLSSMLLAGFVLQRSGEHELCGEVSAGRLRVAVAARDDNGVTTFDGVGLSAGRLVSGARSFVLDGSTADRLVVAGRDSNRPCLVEVSADAPGVTRIPLPGLDQTRKLARLELADVPARVLDVDADRLLAEESVLQDAALAVEQVGSAQAALDIGLAYARRRSQFGRAIGSYQAVKHRFAELALAVENARAAAYYAFCCTFDAAGAERVRAVSLARLVAGQAAAETAEWCMQVQGGQGFRWDNPAHLYLKRAKATGLLFGRPADQRARLAQLLDLC